MFLFYTWWLWMPVVGGLLAIYYCHLKWSEELAQDDLRANGVNCS
jgi:hypothetical protein